MACSISWIHTEYAVPPAMAPSSFMRKWFPSLHNHPQEISLQYNKHECQLAVQHQRHCQLDHRDQYLEIDTICIFRLHAIKTRLWRKGAVIRHTEINRLKRISHTCKSKVSIWQTFLKWVRKVSEVSEILYIPKMIIFPWIQYDWEMSLIRTSALASFYSFREH